jgi:hypothetical protein
MIRYIQIVSFILNHQIFISNPSIIDSSVLLKFLESFCFYLLSNKESEFFPYLWHHLNLFSSNSFIQPILLKIEYFFKILAFLLETNTPTYFKDMIKTFPADQLSTIILKITINSLLPFLIISQCKEIFMNHPSPSDIFFCFSYLLNQHFPMNSTSISDLMEIFKTILPRITKDISKVTKFGSFMIHRFMSQSDDSHLFKDNIHFLVNNIPFLYTLYEEKPQKTNIIKSIGLPNCGNICYIISTLQQLFWISEFREAILSYNSNNKVFQTLRVIFEKLSKPQSSQIPIKNFITQLQKSNEISFNRWSQQDSVEFFLPFLDFARREIPGIASFCDGMLHTTIEGINPLDNFKDEGENIFVVIPLEMPKLSDKFLKTKFFGSIRKLYINRKKLNTKPNGVGDILQRPFFRPIRTALIAPLAPLARNRPLSCSLHAIWIFDSFSMKI